MDIRKNFFYGSLEKKQYDCIKKDIITINSYTMRGILLVEMILSLFIVIFHPYLEFYKKDPLLPFIVAFLVFGLLFRISRFITNKFKDAIIFMYICVVFIHLFGMMMALMQPRLPAVGFVVYYVTLPLLLTDILVRLYSVMAASALFYLLFANFYVHATSIYIDFWHLMIFTIAIIPIAYFVQLRRFRFFYKRYTTSELEKMDLMTGTYNRNHYERVCRELNGDLRTIFIDVNGLHELNNHYGHKQGDEMLKEVAKALKDNFEMHNTFRIGGDEFVCFSHKTVDQIHQDMIEVNNILAKSHYYISYGVGDEHNLHESLRLAEERMYDQKRAFYAQAQNNRRQA